MSNYKKPVCRPVAAFLLIAGGSLLPAQESVSWDGLAHAASGKAVTLVLPDGARIRGKVLSVATDGLSFQVKDTSDSLAYPEGRRLVPRTSVSILELEGRKNPLRSVLVGLGVGAGSVLMIAALTFLRTAADMAPKKDEDPQVSERRVKKYLIGIGAFSVAVGTWFGIEAGRKDDKKQVPVRVIRVIPDAR